MPRNRRYPRKALRYCILLPFGSLRYAKPLDETLLSEIGAKFDRVVTVEDGILRGGVGEAVTAFFNSHGFNVHVRPLGIDDRFVEQGTPAELYAQCGYDADGIYRALVEIAADGE